MSLSGQVCCCTLKNCKNHETMAIGNGMFQAWKKQRKPIHLLFHQIVTCIILNVISFGDEDKVWLNVLHTYFWCRSGWMEKGYDKVVRYFNLTIFPHDPNINQLGFASKTLMWTSIRKKNSSSILLISTHVLIKITGLGFRLLTPVMQPTRR